jgi:hypothetical protein
MEMNQIAADDLTNLLHVRAHVLGRMMRAWARAQ